MEIPARFIFTSGAEQPFSRLNRFWTHKEIKEIDLSAV